MILKIKRIKKLVNTTQVFLKSQNINIYGKKDSIGFSPEDINSYFIKEIKLHIESEMKIKIPNLIKSFSIVKKNRNFEFMISF